MQKLGIVKKSKGNNYQICVGLAAIEDALQSKKSGALSGKEKEVLAFLRLKLEIDFRTLNRSPRQLQTDQHHALYNNLLKYAVVKPVKMKRDGDDIESVMYDRFGYKGIILRRKPYFDVQVLNNFLKLKKIEALTSSEESYLVTQLQSCSIITTNFNETIAEAVNFVQEIKKKTVKLATDSSHDSGRRESYRVLKKSKEITADLLHGALPCLSVKQREGVKNCLVFMIQLQENVEFVITTLKNQESTIRELDTPEITLRRLADVFDDSVQDKGDVLGWFADNQCDLIIDVAEQKWSWKSIFAAIGAIVLGVAQIALGAVLLVASAGTGSFFCNALISEGVSDMIFGIEGLVKGHCTWSEFFDNKVMSLAITVATAGVGALFARGKEASKYAYKAFGAASKQLAKATAKETGENLTKVMAKQVAKKVGKKIVGATVDAGINLATDAIVEQLSQAIENVSASIVDYFDTMCRDEELQAKMCTFLRQQDPQNAEKYLHQITTQILQRRTFLDIWDDIEESAQKGANVLTQAHGNATSHLKMRGEKLKGKRFMKGISYVSRFAPLMTETLKGGMIKFKIEEVRRALINDLESRLPAEHVQNPLKEAKIKEIREKEIAAMKHYLSQEVSKRGKKIATTGLQIVGQELKKQGTKVGREHVLDPVREHIDISRFNNYEGKLKAAKLVDNKTQREKIEGKLQRMMTRTRSPEVFARMIEQHDALLGPAFAVPALERLIGRRIQLVTEDGKPVLNVQEHHAEGDPIRIKFIPGKDGSSGHYYFGESKFTPQQHGNDCLTHAVLAGAGQTQMSVGEIRRKIAEACRDDKHPCHDYIKRGIARNYVKIRVVGGSGDTLTYSNENGFHGKAGWYPHMDNFCKNDWKCHTENAQRSGINLKRWKKPGQRGGKAGPKPKNGRNLQELGLHRCHRLSEKSIQNLIHSAIGPPRNVEYVRRLRNCLLPTIEEVTADQGEARLNGDALRAFMDTYIVKNEDGSYAQNANGEYEKTADGGAYANQVIAVDNILGKMVNNTSRDRDYIQLVRGLSSSPINVSLGDKTTNSFIGEHMDYNPGSPRSERIRIAFTTNALDHSEYLPGVFGPKITKKGNYVTSFWHGEETDEWLDSSTPLQVE